MDSALTARGPAQHPTGRDVRTGSVQIHTGSVTSATGIRMGDANPRGPHSHTSKLVPDEPAETPQKTRTLLCPRG